MIIMVPDGIHIDSIKDKKEIGLLNPNDFYRIENEEIIPENWYVRYCNVATYLSARENVVLIPYNKQVAQYFMEMHRTDICAIYPDLSTFDIKTWVDTIDYKEYTGKKNPDLQYVNTLKRFLTPKIEKDVTELEKMDTLDFFDNICVLMHPNYVLNDIIDTFKLENEKQVEERE